MPFTDVVPPKGCQAQTVIVMAVDSRPNPPRMLMYGVNNKDEANDNTERSSNSSNAKGALES